MALKAVLDTRFFFAFYDPLSHKQEEWCRSIARDAKKSGTYLASCVTIAELYGNMGKRVGKDVVSLRISSMRNAGIEFVPVDEVLARHAGELKLSSGEVPMADAIIASTAVLCSGGRVLTDDDRFKGIKSVKTSWVE